MLTMVVAAVMVMALTLPLLPRMTMISGHRSLAAMEAPRHSRAMMWGSPGRLHGERLPGVPSVDDNGVSLWHCGRRVATQRGASVIEM